ncbi:MULTISPECIES: hypothetical protein [Burkholderiaceae]|uniref:hypothetical protein n=1 Tax=Burkholderiaceae TaxID=119060 RepID=UPI001F3D763D|nr:MULTISPECIES: hypothetical protein [Burkholderiaceae]
MATQLEQQGERIALDAWRPYVLGKMETYDIACTHDDMDRPGPAESAACCGKSLFNCTACRCTSAAG